MQNEFETSVSYKNEEDTGNGTDGSDDGNWTCEEEPLKGTDGSRIAAYHAGKVTWRCYECGSYFISQIFHERKIFEIQLFTFTRRVSHKRRCITTSTSRWRK